MYPLTLLALMTLTACSTPTPEEALQHRLNTFIGLMEAGEYETVLVNYYTPDMVEELKSARNFKKIVKYYGEAPQKEILLRDLKRAKDFRPQFNIAKTKAMFVGNDFESKIKWQRINGNWYLEN